MGKASEVAEYVIAGGRLTRGDDLSWLVDCDLAELGQGADSIRKHYVGDCVDLCTIINARSGKCGEDCRYCAQSARYKTACDEYAFTDVEEIVRQGLENQRDGVDRYAIVTSGKALCGQEFERALEAFATMHDELEIGLCASLGILSRDQLLRLKQAGVSRYHHNIETSRRYFPSICTTHTFEDRLNTIRNAQDVGLEVCSGGIVGMGETWADRMDMAITLAELGIGSIPLNALIAIPGTPLQDMEPLSEEEILRIVALFRYINPTAHVRMAAGRKLLSDHGRATFMFGASAAITGDMLTTTSTSIQSDRAMLTQMGRALMH